jgi:hypothetical protein
VVVAITSGLLAGLWGWLRLGVFGWLLAIATPFIISYSLYWSPVWLGADDIQFGTWAPLFIAPWTAIGEAASLFMFFLVDGARNRKRPGPHFYDPASDESTPPSEKVKQ